jgi:uncharacterized protein
MTQIEQNIYCFPINKSYLVYSPLNDISALLNKQALIELREHIQQKLAINNEQITEIQQLASDILNTKQIKITRKQNQLDPLFLGILPTRACNGACNYCDFGADRFKNDTMSYEIAIKTVNWYTDLVLKQKRRLLEVHFFGGEPMLASDVVEVIVHRARLLATENNITPYFEISTNGQYSEKQAQWIGEYFNSVVLSFDGFEETHNLHRPINGGNSYENVLRTAKIISESNAQLNIRCCISQHNIGQMQELTHWFCQNFRLAALNFEILYRTELTDKKGLVPPDPYEVAVQFQHSKQIAESYGIELIYASDISEKPQVSSCPVGKDTVIVSPNGKISNCYMLPERWRQVGLEFDFGDINNAEAIDQNALSVIRSAVEDKPRCETCFCKWSCAGGCHIGNTPPNCSNNYENYCLQTRIISAYTLLNKLGQHNEIATLKDNKKTLKNLACHKTDVLIDMKI